MAYKHILVAVDLSDESHFLIAKAVSMAKPYDAKVSIIYVDINYSDLYSGLINVNISDMQEQANKESRETLNELAGKADYPIAEKLLAKGDFVLALNDAIKKYDADLILCGHHQDFWSKIISSARQLLSTVDVDMLIVPLKKVDAQK